MEFLNEDKIIDTIVQLNENAEKMEHILYEQKSLISTLISTINDELNNIGPEPEQSVHDDFDTGNETVEYANKAFAEPDANKSISEYEDELKYMITIMKDAFDAMNRR